MRREDWSNVPAVPRVGSGCSARAKIQDLKFIRKSQELGFSLNEIRELLIVLDESVPSCTHVRELLERKLTTVRRKIEELQKLEGSLKSALCKCARTEDLIHGSRKLLPGAG